MAYIVKSDRVGIPGEPFTRTDVNLEALVAGGFIEDVSTEHAAASDKPKLVKPSKE